MKKKKFFSIILIVLLCCSIILLFINPINKCYEYTKTYLGKIPNDQMQIDAINASSQEFIKEKNFKNSIFISKYLKRFLVDKFIYHLDDRMGDEAIITSYYNEIIVLRLKICLIKGEEQSYKELFCKNFDSLDTCWIYSNYLTDLIKDKNYPIEFGDVEFQIIEDTYSYFLDNTDNNIQKFFINESLLRFYSSFEEAEIKSEKCRKLRKELSDEIGSDKIKEEILKRNDLNSFKDKTGDGSMSHF